MACCEQMVFIREFDADKDLEQVERLERRCEVGPCGKVSLFTDLMGDPLCRIRHSPAHVMLVAEFGAQQREIVGLIRGCIKSVVCGRKFSAENSQKEAIPEYTRAAYILGLRVSPAHRRLGIGLKLVQRLEMWLKENGAEYAYMATEKDNEASIKLFTEKCHFSKFRTPAMLVNPVHAHKKRIHSSVKIVKLNVKQAEILYRHRLGTREFFPEDIEAILNNRLNLGTWVAFPRDQQWPGLQPSYNCEPADITKEFPSSWAILSAWNSSEVFKLQVKGVSAVTWMYAAATRFFDKKFPWLKIPSIPDVFHPFGLHFLYGLHAEGKNGEKSMADLWRFSYNLARQRRCRLIATEVGSCDPLKHCIPHWDCFSCPEDLWCIKRLPIPMDHRDSTPDWTKSAPGLQIFVDPREF